MARIFLISFILVPLLVYGQQSKSISSIAEVGFLNNDAIFTKSNDRSPVYPHLFSSPKEPIGFSSNWFSEKKQKNGNSFRFFPVMNGLASTSSNQQSRNSLFTGAGIGFTTHLSKRFYARAIIAGNYFYQHSTSNRSNSIQSTGFLKDGNPNEYFALQPRIRLSYTPFSFLNIQTGIDNHFIGQGNRSMLLGDYGSPYPFVELRTHFWKLELLNVYQFFKENEFSSQNRKFASTHFLNFKATNRFQIGIFESVVFAPKDTLLNRGYDVTYLNPLLFYRPSEYSLGSQDRLLIGLNTSYQFDFATIYGQLAIDDFVLNELVNRTRWWANKYSGQIGIKGTQSTEKARIQWLAELNFARPFMYSHLSTSTNYGNQGFQLAHPLGSNFAEVYAEVGIHYDSRLSLIGRFFFAQQGGADGNDTLSYGSDVYQSYTNRPFEYGYKIGGNGKENRFHFSAEIRYTLIEKMALDVFVRPGIEVSSSSTMNNQTQFFVFGGIRTNLWNNRSFTY